MQRSANAKGQALERRSSKRFQTNLKGWIAAAGASDVIECLVTDLSATGARLIFPGPAEVPVEFELNIPEEAASAKARLVWSTGKEFGIVFTD